MRKFPLTPNQLSLIFTLASLVSLAISLKNIFWSTDSPYAVSWAILPVFPFLMFLALANGFWNKAQYKLVNTVSTGTKSSIILILIIVIGAYLFLRYLASMFTVVG